jgi:divalent metal cation (Fe/Co/Zn/Cd) transporter
VCLPVDFSLNFNLLGETDETYEHLRERRERLALKLVGVCFLLLAAYVLFDSVKTYYYREAPELSLVGIGVTIVSLVVQPLSCTCRYTWPVSDWSS